MPLAIEQLIADFGGVARLATLLAEHFPAEPVSRGAIYKWRERGSLPLAQAERLRVLAQRLGRGFELSDYQRGQAASPAPVTALRVLDVSLAQAPAGVHASWLAALDALGLAGVCLGDALGAPRALLAHCHVTISAVVARKDVWLAAIPEEALGDFGMDQDIFLRIVRRHPAGFIPEVLASYRRSEASVSVRKWRRYPRNVNTLERIARNRLWEGLVPAREMRRILRDAYVENAEYWRGAGAPRRALWFCGRGLLRRPWSGKLWKTVAGILARNRWRVIGSATESAPPI